MNSRREDELLPQDQEFLQGELWLGPTLETDQNRQENT